MVKTALSVEDLRVEWLATPLGLDEPSPRFSWKPQVAPSSTIPQAYRVTVGSEGSTATWCTGWVESSTCFGVECELALQPSTRYDWGVELRDGEGGEHGPFTSWFETGLLQPGAAGGVWIGRDRYADKEVFDPPTDDDLSSAVRHLEPPALLRREFTLAEAPVRARLHISARGLFRAHLNGERVGTDELAPGWTDYNDRVCYQSYDVTTLLQSGDNALGIELADGWYAGYVGFDARRQGNHYGTTPMAWAVLEIDCGDGAWTRIVTDDSWREAAGAIRYSDLLMGEYVDLRLDPGPWTTPAFDDSGWARAAVLDEDLSTIVARRDEPVRVMRRVPALSRVHDENGASIYDFGQNLVGRVRVRLGSLAAGSKVVLRHGEVMSEGRLYTENLRTAEATDVVIGNGSDCVFEPSFTLHGFRFAEIVTSGPAPEPADVEAVVLYSDLKQAGSLVTSSPDVNQLLSNIEWGLRGNYVSVPTDCPQRDERLGWLADAQVFLPTATYLAEVDAFMTQWLRDVRYAQSPHGSFADVAPVVTNFFGDGAPAWADGGVIIPWQLYRTYGDRRLLAESFESMARYADFLVAANPDLIWTRRVGNHYGDWLQVNADTPRPVMATAYLAHSLELVGRAAAVVAPARAQRYRELADGAKAAFVAAFVQPDGRIQGDTQTGYLLALAFDLVPPDLRPALAEHLVRTVEATGGLLTTGFVGVSLLCPVLSSIGRDDLAYALLETDRYPSWLYSVRHGATTIWERWDGWTEHGGFQSVKMNSFNHYSLGSVGEWLYRYVAGIDQTADSIGFEVLAYQPRLGGSLTEVSASFESVRGRIVSRWERTGATATFELTLPPGVRAEVLLPAGDSISVNGEARPVGGFDLGSGTHRMTVAGLTGTNRHV